MGIVVTIDGPAASGKTSVSREVAGRLGWNWVSTGAFYRGLGYAADRLKLDLTNEKVLAELSQSQKWQVKMTNDKTRVFFFETEKSESGEDVTEQISREEIGNIASRISSFPLVRAGLLAAQRNCQHQAVGLIAEGRDCGTVVFPEAKVKIYLTARSEDRAQRRAQEHGKDALSILQDQKQRDHQDSTRSAAPLQIPAGALVLDTSQMSFDEVVGRVEKHVRSELKLD